VKNVTFSVYILLENNANARISQSILLQPNRQTDPWNI
jgi:hypothetical protein